MGKALKIFITGCVTSMFYFPVLFSFFPSYNTKTILAGIGLVLCLFSLVRKKELAVPRNLLPLFILAGLISLIAMFSMAFNRTTDDAYSGYIISMAVWLSAAYVVCSLIKFVHGRIDIELICNYIIVVCVAQCFIALSIDSFPAFKSIADRYVLGNELMEELNRLYGIGCYLDVAGTRFSVALIMIMALVIKHKDGISVGGLSFYACSFFIITVVGSMIARTTYVGVISSIILLLISIDYTSFNLSKNTFKIIFVILTILLLIIVICVVEYRINPNFRYWLRFAFEGFFNLFERGEYTVSSTVTLKSMYVFPDNLKTWIIGDGYFTNSRNDINYLGDATTEGYYMGTDVGYLRFIFYFGVIGLVAFIAFMIQAARTCIKMDKDNFKLYLIVLFANFVIWFKVATDLFVVFALFICIVNLQDSGINEELEQEEYAVQG